MRIVISSLAVLTALSLSACGSDDDGGSTTTTDTGTPVTDTGSSTTDTGSSTTDTGSATTDTGSSTTDTGSSTTDTGSDTGTAFKVVNGCAEADYIDGTTDAAKRKLDPWNTSSGKKCVKIKKGQDFTWVADFTVHPLASFNGDTPSPITTTSTGSTKTFTFANEGTFGYHCNVHSSMTGAIRVVP